MSSHGESPGEGDRPAWRRTFRRRMPWSSYALALVVVALCTAVAAIMAPYFAPPTLIMVYLLGVVLVATRWGRGPSMVASLLSVAAFDFFLVPPYLTLAVADAQYLVIFAVMLVVALVISNLAAQVRQQAIAATAREQRTAVLYDLARDLADRHGVADSFAVVVNHIGWVFDGEVVGLLPDATGHLIARAQYPASATLGPQELRVAQWGYDERVIAGWGIGTLPTSTALYMPLLSSGRPLAVIALRLHTLHWPLEVEKADLLEALVSQASVALERAQLSEEAQKALRQTDMEQLRAMLLRSIAGDLYPSLAALSDSMSSLMENGPSLDAATRQERIVSAYQEISRLKGQVGNLVDRTPPEPSSVEQPADVRQGREPAAETLPGEGVR